MWTPDHRRAADRRGLRYPSDLTRMGHCCADDPAGETRWTQTLGQRARSLVRTKARTSCAEVQLEDPKSPLVGGCGTALDSSAGQRLDTSAARASSIQPVASISSNRSRARSIKARPDASSSRARKRP